MKLELEEMPPKKKAGRPKRSTRDDVVLKADRAVVAKAKYVAEVKGIPLAEYATDAMRLQVERDFAKITREDGAETKSGPTK